MALSFLQSANSTTDTNAYTFSAQNLGAEASDRYIAVTVNGRKAGATTSISSVTIGGVTASIAVQRANTITNTSIAGIVIAAVPTGTTGDIVVTFADTLARCAIGVYRIDNLFSATAYDTDNSVSADPSVGLNVGNPGFAIGTGAASGTGSVTWTGLTEDYDFISETSTNFTGASLNVTATEANRTITIDFSVSGEAVGVFASWQFISGTSKNLLTLGTG